MLGEVVDVKMRFALEAERQGAPPQFLKGTCGAWREGAAGVWAGASGTLHMRAIFDCCKGTISVASQQSLHMQHMSRVYTLRSAYWVHASMQTGTDLR